MSKLDESIQLKNPKKRELSSFMAEQLLYDYATKIIDEKREIAVNTALQSSPALTKSLDDIIYGMTYCHHLRKTTLTPEFLKQFKAKPSWKQYFKVIFNPRRWPKNSSWIIETVIYSSLAIAVTLLTPWTKIISIYEESRKNNQKIFISELPKEGINTNEVDRAIANTNTLDTQYKSIAELHSVNPTFSVNKLLQALPKTGASIEHQAMKNHPKFGQIPYFKLSIPQNQTEALFLELKKQGLLTWISTPAENEIRSTIFGMELWIVRKEPTKGNVPAKELNEE